MNYDFAFDSPQWEESKHKRGQPGQFGPGGGGKKPEAKAKPAPSKAAPAPSKPKAMTPAAKLVSNPEKARSGTVAERTAQVENLHQVYQYLGKVAEIHKKGGLKSRDGFVRDNGVPYIVNDKTYEGPRQQAHMCFKNAANDALSHPDRTYVEGYITVHGVPIEHAWTVDQSGQVYDPTITPSEKVGGYFGVPFKTDYLAKCLQENKVYGLLGHRSKKTLEPLLSGNDKSFKEHPNPDKLSDEAIGDQLAFADRVVKSIPSTDTIQSPERDALRQHVADTLYNHNIEKRNRSRECTIVLGLPGAGKSTFANPLLEDGALEIEGDNAKALLPEFQGGTGAFAVHEEASTIMRNVLAKAMANGDNLVWPRIDSPDKMAKDVENLKKAGYKVHVKLISTDAKVAAESAIKRFFKMGRYVSPEMILSYGNAPRESYDKAKATGLLETHEVHSRGHTGGFNKVES